MNAKRAKIQSELRRNVEPKRIEEAIKKWNETQKKVAEHKRSNKPTMTKMRRNRGCKQEIIWEDR